jgi:hypothetical protein
VLRTGEQDNSPSRRTKSRSDGALGEGRGGGGEEEGMERGGR